MGLSIGHGIGIPFNKNQISWQSYWATREPSNPNITITGSTTATMTWIDSAVLGADGYKVYAGATLKATVAVGVQTADLTGLTADTLYIFKVVAYKGANNSTGVTATATTWTEGEVVIRDGNTAGWYQVGDGSAAYMVKDGSNFISCWKDQSGNNRHLLQSNGTNQPLFSTSEIIFDGIDNIIGVEYAHNQPISIYLVIKQITWTTGNYILTGRNPSTGFVLYQYKSSPIIVLWAGSDSCNNNQVTIDTYKLVRIVINGASSKVQVNNAAAITGNPGAANAEGIVLGGLISGSNASNIAIKEMVYRTIDDSDSDETKIINYLNAKYKLY